MILYPAIDLYDGMAVRLRQGRYDDMTVYDRDPKSLALRMRDAGATHLHMVDLEGARSGSTANLGLIEQIAGTSGLFIELGGGIRSMDTIRRYLDCGISRAILGTAAVEDESLLREALETFGDQIAVGVDLKDGFVAVRGWEEKSSWTAEAFFEHLTELNVRTVICTDISRDGVLAGSRRRPGRQQPRAVRVPDRPFLDRPDRLGWGFVPGGYPGSSCIGHVRRDPGPGLLQRRGLPRGGADCRGRGTG